MTLTRKTLSNILAISGLMLVLIVSYGPGFVWGDTLTIRVTGIRSTEGTVHVMIYDRAVAFENYSETGITSYDTRGAQKGDMSFRFRNMVPGRYAVFVHHDENANNAFDTIGTFEGYGYSRNVGALSDPAFDEAAIAMPADAMPTPIAIIYAE